MKKLPQILNSNKKWATEVSHLDPTFFKKLSTQQNPKYLWIGCSDSRVPATQICGLDPGEMFVHRNVANLVVPNDLNCFSVVQYAVDVLNVTDIIVCGHYGCGGIISALSPNSLGLIDNWLLHIKKLYDENSSELEGSSISHVEKLEKLTELNIKKQVMNLSNSEIIRDAWKRGRELNLHGWVYHLEDGLLKDLDVTITSEKQADQVFKS